MVDQNSIFGGMLTTLGAAKKTNCDALGIPWEPRYMLIGDANGTDPVPSPSQTKLINQRYRAQLNQLRVSPTDDNVLIAELVLPPDVGGWWIRELALEDKDGVFSAVANVAPSYKPLLAQGSGRNQVVRMHVITSGTANIQLKIDPSVVLATREFVNTSILNVLPADKSAGTFTKVTINDRGIVQSGSNPTTLTGYGVDFASKVDAETGTDTERPMNALRVFQAIAAKVMQATETALGVAKIGSQNQVDSGTDDAVYVTPKKLRWGFQILKQGNGYVVFPTWLGGLVIQWGFQNVPGSTTATYPFPMAFPNSGAGITASFGIPAQSSVNADIVSANQYRLQNLYTGQQIARWIAIGY